MDSIISLITAKDDKEAYENIKEIAAMSANSPEFYQYFEDFASLLGDEKSYVRTRAFILCCSQARWDSEGKIKEVFPKMELLFNDPKATVVRQCLSAIKEVVLFRAELDDDIKKALAKIDLSQYKDSMSPLIEKDIKEVEELLWDQKRCSL